MKPEQWSERALTVIWITDNTWKQLHADEDVLNVDFWHRWEWFQGESKNPSKPLDASVCLLFKDTSALAKTWIYSVDTDSHAVVYCPNLYVGSFRLQRSVWISVVVIDGRWNVPHDEYGGVFFFCCVFALISHSAIVFFSRVVVHICCTRLSWVFQM